MTPKEIIAFFVETDCANIAWDLHNSIPAWKIAKYNYTNELAGLGSEIRELTLKHFKSTGSVINLLNWGDYAYQLGAKMRGLYNAHSGESNARAALNRLARAYATSGCWNPDSVNWAPYTSGGSSSELEWHCENQLWEISFDGGETWQPIIIEVCGYSRLASAQLRLGRVDHDSPSAILSQAQHGTVPFNSLEIAWQQLDASAVFSAVF